jgi:hypothetical protein
MADKTIVDVIRETGIVPMGQLQPFLYQDEIDDPFLLTTDVELYYFGADEKGHILGAYNFTYGSFRKLKAKGIIFDVMMSDRTSPNFFKIRLEHLPYLLKTGKRRSRLEKTSGVRKRLEDRLGHRIFNYNPLEVTDARMEYLRKYDKKLYAIRKQQALALHGGGVDEDDTDLV